MRRLLLIAAFSLIGGTAASAQLNEHCTVSVLNRTARVNANGEWLIANVPINAGFYSALGAACSTMAQSLLTSDTDSGQCGSFANLLVNSFALNGIASAWVDVTSKNGAQFMVRDWTAGTPSYPNGPPIYSPNGPPSPDWKPYIYKLEFNPAAIAPGNFMEPGQGNEIYGDLTSLPTIPGQNTRPPREKIFISPWVAGPKALFSPNIRFTPGALSQ